MIVSRRISRREKGIITHELRKAKLPAGNPSVPESEADAVVSRQIALKDAHPRQQRRKYVGEEIQMDGSFHLWFGPRKTVLYPADDNAIHAVGAFFDRQETLDGYFHVFDQILRNYGIPAKFKIDNRSVFYYRSSAMKDNSKDVLTQFNYLRRPATWRPTRNYRHFSGERRRRTC